MMVRDMDLAVPHAHTRRLEVVADGLPLFGGTQLAIDTTVLLTGTVQQTQEGAGRTTRSGQIGGFREVDGLWPGLEGEVGFNLGVQRCSGFRFSAELASHFGSSHFGSRQSLLTRVC